MKISVLDRASLGEDTPFEVIETLGDVVYYDKTDSSCAVKNISDSEVIIINKVKIDKNIIKNCKNLKLICVFATGYDNIDIAAAKKYNVAVCNVPAYSTNSVSLYTVSTVLALYTKILQYNDFVRSGKYSQSEYPNLLVPVYHEIFGKTWGVLGLGNIGRAVADVAKALGCRVLATKRTPAYGFECVDLDTLCKESDIITVHCPLNESTFNIINKEKINLMKTGVVIVNEARGAVLNESDIRDGILSGKIGAFGCDVYSKEPFGIDLPYNEIKNLDNVILTPHCAWGAYEARERCVKIILENIKSFYSNGNLNRVDL